MLCWKKTVLVYTIRTTFNTIKYEKISFLYRNIIIFFLLKIKNIHHILTKCHPKIPNRSVNTAMRNTLVLVNYNSVNKGGIALL